ncbi:precorrin-6y C5,15-methyltransferase (decarboxylating) subunit CbiE [Dactylosporangium vinaceum]|uniref:Precorrin-6y C5,15-methyltransferase (Decarboxylating) subunit CbiE n=1 Tax=Dactylosporangium vinaceum TaxID=53362 RepID=A0ABV5MG63_9ACTN|nr:precorrin-6y C5,15-methyltransferase (decarboxylating) subunit CbiE [Dactylosporangium vinaceum]UAB98980.1 precorrin-6y C5,15-methyltransferase (decarboxylating) subunit CbiE [Dactylosporangium vinaceum]
MRLVVGLGARSSATPDDVLALLRESNVEDDVLTLSTVDSRRALASVVAAEFGWSVVTFPAEQLAAVAVASPSPRVRQALGTPSVAEASALLVAGGDGAAAVLLTGKQSSPSVTIAVAAPAPDVVVVGIGADGDISAAGRAALERADVVFGGPRQLALLGNPAAKAIAWPSPLVPALPRLLAEQHGRSVCVLASGDPMHYGIGTTLVRLLGAAHVRVVPQPSSISHACARLGWAVEDTEVVRDIRVLPRVLHDGRRVLVLSAGSETPRDVWRMLEAHGFADSEVTILEDLGSVRERIHHDPDRARPLNIVAVLVRGGDGVPLGPGVADERYDSDGQLTKREIRAVTLAALGPRPGELLWDVGAGSGSIAVEWSRAHPSCRAVAFERDSARAERIGRNAHTFGVPGLEIVVGAAPSALAGRADRPDAIFIGGGFTAPGVFEACWHALRPGGRLVVNAVTIESERLVAELQQRHGGDLTRIAVNRAAPIGGFLGWRPMLPVTQWTVRT